MVVIERAAPTTRGWSPRRTFTGGCDQIPEPAWHSCPRCWGQRVEFASNLRDWRTCVVCLGVGEVPSA